ncbi:acyl carrier protein [Saccharopolyspora tripterygii]
MLSLTTVRSELLDCVQANLAVLADHHHGPGAHLNLGAELRMSWRGDELPTVEPELERHLADARRLLGLDPSGDEVVVDEPLTERVRPGQVAYVVADAFELPWVPYFGQRHMEHSFLLGPDGTVHDAYDNDTPWGPAAPGTWHHPGLRLAGPARVLHFDPVPIADPVPTVADVDVAQYLRAYKTHADRVAALERLTLETWLLRRSRALHAAFREHRGEPEPAAVAEHLQGWNALVEQTYLAARRVARGRPEPSGVLERMRSLLATDRTVFAADGDYWRQAVASEVAAVLEVDAQHLLDGMPFSSSPRFSSFRLVEIVERLESELGADIDADDLIPENLHRLDDLCRVSRPFTVLVEGVTR